MGYASVKRAVLLENANENASDGIIAKHTVSQIETISMSIR